MDLNNLSIYDEGDYKPSSSYSNEKKLQFDPLVYIQRYFAVLRILQNKCWDNKIKKVLDAGCAEIKFFTILKTLQSLEHLIEVDIDEMLLKFHCRKVSPLLCEYLNPRENPLTVEVYRGNVCESHECLLNCDAVVAIELIEHLYPKDLENLPYNLFGYIKPKLIILTTPNSEFNVLFDSNRSTGFRHDDHKFEWTRQQFQDWANNLCERYPDYKVKFFGIGVGPEGNESIGCCTQMCVFVRKDMLNNNCDMMDLHLNDSNEAMLADQSEETSAEYQLLHKCVYPNHIESRTHQEILLDELKYHIGRYMNMEEDYYNITEWKYEIPLEELFHAVTGDTAISMDDIKKVLIDNSYEINEQNVVIINDDDRSERDEFNDSPLSLDIDEW